MKKNIRKLDIRIKINIIIFGLLAVLFAFLPRIMFAMWYPVIDDNVPQYEGGFAYVLNDICPCPANDDSCIGYYACGPDKANITYNLDNAPEDLLAQAKRDQYFEGMIEATRQSAIVMRQYLLCDICYLMAFISVVVGVIYWNHNKSKA